jgi:hypothetical protein
MSFTRYKVTYYGWHDLPQGLWIFNEYFKAIEDWLQVFVHNIMQISMFINVTLIFFVFQTNENVFNERVQ